MKAKILLGLGGVLMIVIATMPYIPYLQQIPITGTWMYQLIIGIIGALSLILSFNKNIY